VRGDAGKLVRDTRTEIRKITWPSREDVVRLTIVVVLLSLAMAFFLGIVVDGLFGFLYRQLVGL
jgi:preprotein translocase subunit SecE